MQTNQFLYFLIRIIFFCSMQGLYAREAVVCVPVTDALINSAYAHHPDIDYVYATLAYMPSYVFPGIARSCQFLFNTVVDVTCDIGDEVRITAYNLFYGIDPEKHEKQRSFWVQKHAITYLDDLPQAARVAIPRPHREIDEFWHDKNVIVLTLPWYSNAVARHFSVGTRFVRNVARDTLFTYGIAIWDPISNIVAFDHIPKNRALIEGSVPVHERRHAMVAIIKSWIGYAQAHATTIPYVWGGSSFMEPGVMHPFLWGFDCSSLIVRAAHIVGIGLSCKISATMSSFLKPLAPEQILERGDIIWYPGHVIVIDDPVQHSIVQARGYESGYGYMYVGSLGDHFEQITTFDDLMTTYLAQSKITILSKSGAPLQTHDFMKILKLPVTRADVCMQNHFIGKPCTIILDPGHGGSRMGCKSATGIFFEKALALDMAKRVRNLLEHYNVRVILTREQDKALHDDLLEDLKARVALVEKNNGDLFVSLHFNASSTDSKTRGFEVYVPYSKTLPLSAYRVAAIVHHALSQGMQSQWAGNLGNLNTRDRGIRAARFNVLSDVPCPAVLIELDYITHPDVENDYKSMKYRAHIAHILADAIVDAMRSNEI